MPFWTRRFTRNFFSYILPVCLIALITVYRTAQFGQRPANILPARRASHASADSAMLKVTAALQVNEKRHTTISAGDNSSSHTTTRSVGTTTETINSRTRQIQTERQQRIAEICSQWPSMTKRARVPNKIPWKLNKRDKYLYCPVPKAGWSSWKRLWFYTSGIIDSYDTDVGTRADTDAGVSDIRNEYEAEAALKRKLYDFSFTFVRDPWERLASAYINKAIDYNYTRELHTPCRWESMEPYKPDLTFEQFLTCIDEGSNDMHWLPQWSLCNICRYKFDFIGHMETAADDAVYVINVLGMNATYPHSFASQRYSTKDAIKELYRSIPADLVRSLARHYELDFLLHGYSPRPPGRDYV